MNDQTPRRGSLLERAAGHFQYAPTVPLDDALFPIPQAPKAIRKGEDFGVKPAVAHPVADRDTDPIDLEANPAEGGQAEATFVQAEEAVAHFTEERRPVVRAAPLHDSPTTPPAPAFERSKPVAASIRRKPSDRKICAVDREVLRAGGMIVPDEPITRLAEEFRIIKRQLLLTARAVASKDDAMAADRARMVLVCGANPNEGKSFCAINLALSMAAEKDVEILLVDADFAKPDVLERLGLPDGPGLLDALSDESADVEDFILQTDIPQLTVLPAGTKTNLDTELLASERAHALFDGLAAANPRRMVIFDSPPALAASLASVLALHVGQVLMIVRADKTSESDLRDAVNALDGCEHIQLVLNAVTMPAAGRRFGSYYYYGEGAS